MATKIDDSPPIPRVDAVVLAGGKAERLPNKLLLPVWRNSGMSPLVIDVIQWVENQLRSLDVNRQRNIFLVEDSDSTISCTYPLDRLFGQGTTNLVPTTDYGVGIVRALDMVARLSRAEVLMVVCGDNWYPQLPDGFLAGTLSKFMQDNFQARVCVAHRTQRELNAKPGMEHVSSKSQLAVCMTGQHGSNEFRAHGEDRRDDRAARSLLSPWFFKVSELRRMSPLSRWAHVTDLLSAMDTGTVNMDEDWVNEWRDLGTLPQYQDHVRRGYHALTRSA